jgi:NADPH:quinone reductase-like Zn-dependent oxidoreductase
VIGVEWPSYYERAPRAVAEAQDDIWAGYAEGSVRPVIWKVLPLAGLVDALEAIESRESHGKVVIDVGPAPA